MRNVWLGLMLVPALVGGQVLFRGNRVANAAPSQAAADLGGLAARALTGRFRAPAERGPDGTRPAIDRTACTVDAPGLGARVVYLEDAFATRPGRPFAQRLLALEPLGADTLRVREFAFVDPEAAVGLCANGVRPVVYRANTLPREGCALDLRRDGGAITGTLAGDRCPSRINDAHHLTRTLTLRANSVEVAERGLDAAGAVVWGDRTAPLRFARR